MVFTYYYLKKKKMEKNKKTCFITDFTGASGCKNQAQPALLGKPSTRDNVYFTPYNQIAVSCSPALRKCFTQSADRQSAHKTATGKRARHCQHFNRSRFSTPTFFFFFGGGGSLPLLASFVSLDNSLSFLLIGIIEQLYQQLSFTPTWDQVHALPLAM